VTIHSLRNMEVRETNLGGRGKGGGGGGGGGGGSNKIKWENIQHSR
jgi:hypothetical protein